MIGMISIAMKSSARTGIAIIPLLLFVLLLVLVISLFGGKKLRRVLAFAAAAVLVLAVILGGLSLLPLTRMLSNARMQARENLRSRVEMENSQGLPPEGLPPEERTVEDWIPSAEHPFLANVYPTLRSAAIGVSRISMEKWLQTKKCRRILISGNVSSDLKKEVVAEAITPLIEHRSPPITVDIEADGVPQPQTQPAEIVRLNFEVLSRYSESSGAVEPDSLVVSTTWHDGSHSTKQVQIANEPWCEDFDRWVAQQPGNTWLTAHSGQLCSTSSEAMHQALQQAAVKIEQRITPDFQRRQSHDTPLTTSTDSRWLREKIVSELRRGTFEKRTFSQRLHRPYGNLWRCAILVDASPDRLAYVKGEYLDRLQSWRTGWMRTMLSAAGLLAVILLAYLFLNAATKGYYVWSIRGAAVVLTAVGIWLVLTII